MKATRVLRRRISPPGGERGVSLIIVMLILIVVTIVGIGGAQLALLGERSTRYDRDYLVASQAAEAALKDAEADIAGLSVVGTSTLTPTTRSDQFAPGNGGLFVAGCGTTATNRGLCDPPDDTAQPVWATVDFLDTSASAHTVGFGAYTSRAFQSGSGVQPALKPRYIIELIPDNAPRSNASSTASPPPKMYRITAIGFGPRQEVQVVMQTGYRKQIP